MDDKARFFVALVPGEPIRTEVRDFKETAAERFRAQRALKSPAHITLQPPFEWPGHNIEEVMAVLDIVALRQRPFEVTLRNFGSFPPDVIYITVEADSQLLDLRDEVMNDLHGAFDFPKDTRDFRPHVTVAFRDLKRDIYPEAMKHFSAIAYERTFRADHLTLLKHDDRRWNIYEIFEFGR